MARESAIEAKFRKRVRKELGGRALKFVSPGFNGVPDRIVLLLVQNVEFAEIKKTGGGEISAAQVLAHREFAELGFNVWLIDCDEHITEFIKYCIDKYCLDLI